MRYGEPIAMVRDDCKLVVIPGAVTGLSKDLSGSCGTACDMYKVACRVACARYGGPIAMVRDDRKLVVIQGAATKPVVRVFTAAGQALAAFMWDRGRVVGMGWSNQEDLLIAEDTGQVC